MMKWKVVRNQPRSQSADRSLEWLKKSESNESNEEGKENKAPEKDRQRATSLVRKTSVLATECINLRSILGLARQRSETNLSSVGLVHPPPAEPARRSRSEVRLTATEGQTRSSSPPVKGSGWLRGRKRERESRKYDDVPSGKTVVTGTQRKKRNAGPKHPECSSRTDSSGVKIKGCGPRKCKTGRKDEEDIIEEEDVYVELTRREEERTPPRARRAGRKKGQAPKPQPAHASPGTRKSEIREEVHPTTVVAEVHEELLYLSMDLRTSVDVGGDLIEDHGPSSVCPNAKYESLGVPEPDPFHIDTPDYSTLESTTGGVAGESQESGVQFGRMDLIDQYRKHKTAEEESNPGEVAEGAEEAAAAAEEPSFVVKKSFVLTVAKQEKGFQSLCANKKPEPPPAPPADHISVTFRCSDARKRSESVPPARNALEGSTANRGRSRDRKSHTRKSKGKKKDSGFVMPQAVIDELSQVLEKRKPSLDEMTPRLIRHPPSSC